MYRSRLLISAMLLALATWPAIADDTTAPVIASVVVTPAVVACLDTVHVAVTATDDTAVMGVTADALDLENTSGNLWEGDIAANTAIGTHNVSVIARDAAGNTKADTTGSYRTAQVMGLRNDQVYYSAVASKIGEYLFRVWGRAAYRDENTFTLNDGGSRTTWVICPGHGVCNDDYVAARGVLDPSVPPAKLTNVQYQIYQQAPREQMDIGDVTVGKDLQRAHNGKLPNSVPLGTTLPVTMMSSDPSKVRLSRTAGGSGTASIVVTVSPGSTSIPTFYIHGLDSTGVVDVIATAPGCLGRTFRVTLAPSGFAFGSAANFSTTVLALNTALDIRPAQLNPTNLSVQSWLALRGGITVDVPVTSANPSVGTITTSPVVFANGDDLAQTFFDPIAAGTSVLSVGTPTGFSTPANYRQITATVTASDVVGSDQTVGVDLQIESSARLQAAPSSPVDITVTVADASKATLTLDPLLEGAASITIPGISDTEQHPYYVQGRGLGATTMSLSAPGYNTRTYAIAVNPSGFVIITPTAISTTSFSPNTALSIRPARLKLGTLQYQSYQPVRGGKTVDVTVTSADPAVGVLTPATIHFASNSTSPDAETAFDPIGAGTTIVSVVPPAGFSAASTYGEITATVTASDVLSSNQIVGVDLQTSTSVHLQLAPPEPVDITVTVADDSIATLSASATTEGSASVTFAGVTTTGPETFYVQGRAQGATTMTCSAPGYDPRTYTVTVTPSGFYIEVPAADVRTTVYSANTSIRVKPMRLDPSDLDWVEVQAIRAGRNVSVTVSNSNPGAGTITESLLAFSGNVSQKITEFDPLTIGETTVTVETPAGFSTPSTDTQRVFTVALPNINGDDETVGRDLQTGSAVRLEAAPPSPVTITVTVSDPAKAAITPHDSPTAAGSGSLTFTGVRDTNNISFYVQGLATGTTTIVSSAPGYADTVQTVTIVPSGFVISSPPGSFTTTVGAADKAMAIYTARLNPSTLAFVDTQPVRGGLSVDVYVVSSNTAAGTITASPLLFGPNVTNMSTAFHPLAVGVTALSVEPPTGFDTPSNKRVINATVNP